MPHVSGRVTEKGTYSEITHIILHKKVLLGKGKKKKQNLLIASYELVKENLG